MYYVNFKQKKIMDGINKFSCMTYEQIKKLNNLKDLDKQLKILVNQKKLKLIEENVYVPIGNKAANKKILRVLDVYIHLAYADSKVPIEWCEIVDFPFILAFFRNNKIFHIAVIDEGEELAYSTAINRSEAERIILILENVSQMEKIKINKNLKCCTVKNGVVIFL